uniref:C2H2-type domain-containing protein n=1 Tax=Timema monikensis TaxID=170555 RepID=A0A7R9E224_9NEOP|nr:unnamed protein product [Timema monikensis]
MTSALANYATEAALLGARREAEGTTLEGPRFAEEVGEGTVPEAGVPLALGAGGGVVTPQEDASTGTRSIMEGALSLVPDIKVEMLLATEKDTPVEVGGMILPIADIAGRKLYLFVMLNEQDDGYSPRDHSHHRSPDIPRKRLRTEQGYVQASSGRRSHEGGYSGASDYTNRYSYSEVKGGYGEERGRGGYRDERRSSATAGFRDRSRDDYSHRKSEDSGMPPPSSAPMRHLSTRGSYRGRISTRGRGMSRIMTRRTEPFFLRKRGLLGKMYPFPTRESRLLMICQKRLLSLACDFGVYWLCCDEVLSLGDVFRHIGLGNNEEDEELEEGETKDKKEKPKVVKKKKVIKKKPVEKEEPEEGEEVEEEEGEADAEGGTTGDAEAIEVDAEEEDEDDEEDGDTNEDGEADVSKSSKKSAKSEGGVHVTIKQDSDGRDVSEESRPKHEYIRLSCPLCFFRCFTFHQYHMHLRGVQHMGAMRRQNMKLKQTLATMRMKQRRKQHIVESTEEDLSPQSNFCYVCKLNYRQLKTAHTLSDSHRSLDTCYNQVVNFQAMKRFLMPSCTTCNLRFKSPMQYEYHICSLYHIKKKAAAIKERSEHDEKNDEEGEGSGMDDKDINMDNFMILDSVGSADGNEYVKQIEVLYCELCMMYLSRHQSKDKALALHCRTRTHLQRYVRYRDDRALRREAERIHRKEQKEKEAREIEAKKKATKKEKADTDDENADKEDAAKDDDSADVKKDAEGDAVNESVKGDTSMDTGEEGGAGDELETHIDDKMWAHVDKELGDLLCEVEPANKSSDEDEDGQTEGGRYDRFRYSEKGAKKSPSGDAPKAVNGKKTDAVSAVDGEEKEEKVTSSTKGESESDKASTANAASPAVQNNTDEK